MAVEYKRFRDPEALVRYINANPGLEIGVIEKDPIRHDWVLIVGNPSFPGGGGGGKVKVTSNDTTADYLLAKLAAGSGVTLTELNDGANEQVEISVPGVGTDTFALVAARNLIASNVYLRGPNGTPTNLSGFVLPFNTKLIAMGAATLGVETWTAEIRRNNLAAVVASLSITAADKDWDAALSVDLNAGDEVQMYCNGTGIGWPTVVAVFERR